VPHDFRYRLFMMFLDLEELPALFDGRWLWSARRPAAAWFRRSDYLGDRDVALDRAVRDEAERLTGQRPHGPVRMLTHLRYFGYVMNPVTFYYCFDRDDRLRTVLAEITNTPWAERHTYAVTTTDGEPAARLAFDKAFHISPFMGMRQRYEWRFDEPGDRLRVHMRSREDGEPVFGAWLSLERKEITGPALAGVLLRYPWMTARVAGGIYWQALRLRLKGNPYHEHPGRQPA